MGIEKFINTKSIITNCAELWYSEKENAEFLIYFKDIEKDEYHCMHYLPEGSSTGLNKLEDLKRLGFEYKEEFERFFKYATMPEQVDHGPIDIKDWAFLK